MDYYKELLKEPLSSQDIEALERLSIDVATQLVEARTSLSTAKGHSSAVGLSSEDKRRVQLEFDTKNEAADVAMWENIQYVLNRRIEILREGK